MEMYIGLDVHSKKTVYVTQDENGQVLGQGFFMTSEEGFINFLGKEHVQTGTKIALETGTQATWLAEILSRHGMVPFVIDAREVRIKAKRIRQKSDLRDAFELCDGLRRGIYTTIVWVPGHEIRHLRRVISRRRHFVNLSTSQVNAVKYILRSTGLAFPSLTTWHAWEKLINSLRPVDYQGHVAMHGEIWRMVQENINSLDRDLKKAVQPFSKVVERLQTVPGVGILTAATYVAVLGDPNRFPDSDHAASYIGIVSSSYDTGDKVRHGAITKRGSAELRAMLCEAAHHASNPRHPLNPYFRRVAAKGGYKKAVVSVAHRLARILFRMWQTGQDFRVEKLNVVADEHLRSKIVYFRIKRPAEQMASVS